MKRLSTLLLPTLFAVPLCAGGLATTTYAASVAAGRTQFHQHCSICHSDKPDVNKIGPSLFGVVGRHIGREPHYDYSQADRHSNITWTPAELNLYINHPQKIVPGTKMPYTGLHNAKKRKNLIAFLKTLKQPGSSVANSAGSHGASAVHVANQSTTSSRKG